MFKRVTLLLLTNLAVLMVLGVVMLVLTATGILPPEMQYDWPGLLIMAAVFGFGGSFISLALSKTIAKWTTKAQVIKQPRSEGEAWLLQTVQGLAQNAKIGMPEVAIYPAPEINAFATGMSKNNALVAVSDGLLRGMRRDEIEGVLAHEIAHVANGDMVTLTLIQGVLNTFVIFLSRILGRLIDQLVFRNERGYGPGYFLTVIVLQIVFGILATMIVMWFSRWREFRADAGGAALAGPGKMVAALERLQSSQESTLPSNMQAMGIRGGGGGFAALFRSHPPLPKRIARLRAEARFG